MSFESKMTSQPSEYVAPAPLERLDRATQVRDALRSLDEEVDSLFCLLNECKGLTEQKQPEERGELLVPTVASVLDMSPSAIEEIRNRIALFREGLREILF